MKNFKIPTARALVFILAILSNLDISAQTRIDYGDISINGVFLGSGKETLLEKFGQPDTTLLKTNEFEETPYYEYVYGESVFFISVTKLEGFNIQDSVYRLDGIDVQTGDRIGKLKLRFPDAFEDRYRDEDMTVVKVRIGQADTYILFHCSHDVIRSISTWDDL